MCGINGIFGLEQIQDPRNLIERMNEAVAHRGPDAHGVYVGDNVAFGHRRLSIIDTSPAGNQPFYSGSGDVVLIQNGELYNYLELKEELKDYPFKTSNDTEVMLAAYLKWGISCIQKFNGMFALAIFDNRSGELYLVRDRLGIKPLYISRKGQHLVFSSEIRSLISSGLVSKNIDQDALGDYLRYGTVHAPATILEEVEMMLPGHYLKITDNETEVKQYWDLTTRWDTSASYMSREQVKEKVAELMRSSINFRMRADVPFGAFLSGGIDSSIIVGLMSEISSHPVSTFSVVFREQEYSEAKYARMIADKFSTKHHEIELSIEDFKNQVPDALEAMDHPSGDGPNTYVVSKVTKEAGITMALSGLGGDELFAGYDVFRRMSNLHKYRWTSSFPKGIRNMGTSLLTKLRPGVASEKIKATFAQDYLDFEYIYPINRLILLDPQVNRILKSGLPSNKIHSFLKSTLSYGETGFSLPVLSKVSYAEINTYMQNVLLRDSDQMSMAHALEVRVPFLDHRLVEFIAGVPDDIKYPNTPKQLLTESFEDMLPREVVDRPKMGFTFPWEIWMKNDLRALCEEKIKILAERKEFESRAVLDLWNQFLEGKITWSRVWHLVVLGYWLEKHGIA